MSNKNAVRNREFKIALVDRMIAGENVSELAREAGVHRCMLYRWRDAYRSGGPEAVRKPGRGRAGGAKRKLKPVRPDPQARIKELERKIGQQQLDLDFFRRALRQVEDLRRSAACGEPRSTESSK
jgi:transposase-like protein